MTKDELLEKCRELGLKANQSMNKDELQALLDEHAASQEDETETPEDETETPEDETETSKEEDEDEDTEVVHLKLARRHPANKILIGDKTSNILVVGYSYKPYKITEAIAEQLQGKGGRHWVAIKELEEEK